MPVMSHVPGDPDIVVRGIVDPNPVWGKVFIEIVIIHVRRIFFITPLVRLFIARSAGWGWSLLSLIGDIDDATRKE
jgi:hypothetical protein